MFQNAYDQLNSIKIDYLGRVAQWVARYTQYQEVFGSHPTDARNRALGPKPRYEVPVDLCD